MDERLCVGHLDGRTNDRLYIWGNIWEVREDGRQEVRRLGLKATDSTTGRILAEGLDGQAIDWIEADPNGTSIYMFGPESPTIPVNMGSSMYVLRRLDATTLAVLAERKLRGFREHVLVVEEAES